MLMSNKKTICLVALSVVLLSCLQACKHKNKPKVNTDSFMAGSANFLVDESLAPIIDEEAYVFKALYNKAKPHLLYKPENELLNLLLNDSVTFAIMSRDLSAREAKIMTDHNLPPDVNKFAVDAITLIVNEASADTLLTVAQVKKMLNSKEKTDINIVFDNPNSSLARYLKELSGNYDLSGKNIYALKTNKEVINYVSQHKKAIGIIGFSWLNDPDADYAAAVNKVKIVGIKDENRKDDVGFTKPSQETLALNQYPFIRSIYIVNCTGRQGLASGFAGFLLSDRGQRIVLKSGILPEHIPGREVNITQTIN